MCAVLQPLLNRHLRASLSCWCQRSWAVETSWQPKSWLVCFNIAFRLGYDDCVQSTAARDVQPDNWNTSGTNFLLLFVFLISSILHHHPALLHRHALILGSCWLFSWHFTVRLHAMQRTVLLSQLCPSVRPSDACIVTKLNNALRIFWYHTKRQSL